MAKQGPIILIDDDEDEYELMQDVLTRQSIPNQLIYFSNGQEAIDFLLITHEKPFLILCDMNIPGLNGIEVREKIWVNEQLRQKSIPFVFYTTAAARHSVNEAYQMSVQGFFIKGYDLDKIGKLIQAIYTYWSLCEYPMI